MGAVANVNVRSWRPGEKARHAAKNDIKSLELSLRVLRDRNPQVGRARAWLIRMLGGTVGRADELREIRRLEGLLENRRKDLRALP